MSQSKEEPQKVNETITEAIVLLAGLAEKTLRQELEKIQSCPNTPFFLKLKPGLPGKENDEDYQRDIVELQNFANVLAETMAQLLKQAEQSLLEKMKKTQTQKNTDKIDEQKQRENEVQNFTKIFADTRAELVEQVENLANDLRKGVGQEVSPKKSESIFSTLGIDDTLPKPKKRPAPMILRYDRDREPPKKPHLVIPKSILLSKKNSPASEDDKCHICGEFGHWAYQCTKPDTRLCYICHQKGHISTQCTEPGSKHCYICSKKGHIASECVKAPERIDKRNRERGRKRT